MVALSSLSFALATILLPIIDATLNQNSAEYAPDMHEGKSPNFEFGRQALAEKALGDDEEEAFFEEFNRFDYSLSQGSYSLSMSMSYIYDTPILSLMPSSANSATYKASLAPFYPHSDSPSNSAMLSTQSISTKPGNKPPTGQSGMPPLSAIVSKEKVNSYETQHSEQQCSLLPQEKIVSILTIESNKKIISFGNLKMTLLEGLKNIYKFCEASSGDSSGRQAFENYSTGSLQKSSHLNRNLGANPFFIRYLDIRQVYSDEKCALMGESNHCVLAKLLVVISGKIDSMTKGSILQNITDLLTTKGFKVDSFVPSVTITSQDKNQSMLGENNTEGLSPGRIALVSILSAVAVLSAIATIIGSFRRKTNDNIENKVPYNPTDSESLQNSSAVTVVGERLSPSYFSLH